MDRVFLHIYDFFATRRGLLWTVFGVLSMVLAVMAWQVEYEESLYSIMPDDRSGSRATEVLRNLKVKDKVVVIFSTSQESAGDPEQLCEAAAWFEDRLIELTGGENISSIVSQTGEGEFGGIVSLVYDDLPSMLGESDYDRLDSLLSTPGALDAVMERNRRVMGSIAGIGLSDNILRDPLGIAVNSLARLRDFEVTDGYQLYDGRIFSMDLRSTIMVVNPLTGMGDSKANERLTDALNSAMEDMDSVGGFPGVSVLYMGGPTVAAYNARQIKNDTATTMTCAMLVVVIFISLCFRNRGAVILMIAPVVFGALFALAMVWLVGRGAMSGIALGAGSVVFGIALSYSIHVISHVNHTTDPRQVIRELAYPLTVGSFTTIGAFLGLLFTDSQLLRDFGLFSAFVLVGTTLFCLVFLPHLLTPKSISKGTSPRLLRIVERITGYRYDRNKWLVAGIIALTIVCAFFQDRVSFDSDMTKLSYTPGHITLAEQKMAGLFGDGTRHTVPFVALGSTPEEAYQASLELEGTLDSLRAAGTIDNYHSANYFAVPLSVQSERIGRWNDYWDRAKREAVIKAVNQAGIRSGFADGAFARFTDMVTARYTPDPGLIAADNVTHVMDDWINYGDSLTMYLTQVNIADDMKESVYAQMAPHKSVVVADRGYFANSMASAVSHDFNLILLISSILIFGALLLSYGRIELALLAFLPMAVSWVIILGIMGIFGIEFNLVNIILATFIFGVGDDFSIFIMDGLLGNYKDGKRLLATHKTAIFFSAFTTVAGMGALIVSRHPALHSVSVISLVGMLTVVLVSFTVQPVIFRLLITSHTDKGGFPYTLKSVLESLYSFALFVGGCLVLQVMALVLFILPVRLRTKRVWLHMIIYRSLRIFLWLIYFVRKERLNPAGERFEKPAVVIANHMSFTDLLVVLSTSPKFVLITKSWVWNSPVFGLLVRFAGFVHAKEGYEGMSRVLRERVAEGYSGLVFPEGRRSRDGKLGRFHKGAFSLAEELGLDIIPLVMYGNGQVISPRQPFYVREGILVSEIMPRIPNGDPTWGEGYAARSKRIHDHFAKSYAELESRYCVPAKNPFFHEALMKNYIYKGPVLEWYMRLKVHMERCYGPFESIIPKDASVVDLGCGYGPMTYMLAMTSRERTVTGIDYDPDKIALAEHCFLKRPGMTFVCADIAQYDLPTADVYLLSDVLHYLDPASQDELLERCFVKMARGGMVIVREGDSSKSQRHRKTELTEKWSTRLVGFNKTSGALHFTSTERLTAAASRHGLVVEIAGNARHTSNTIYVITHRS